MVIIDLEPIEDEAEKIDLPPDAGQGGDDDGSDEDNVAETQEREGPGSPGIPTVQLSPCLWNTKRF